jgi:hypothetical protein
MTARLPAPTPIKFKSPGESSEFVSTIGTDPFQVGRAKYSRHVGQRGVGIGSGGIAGCGFLARNLACRLLSLKTNSANAIHQITSETDMMLNVVMWCERRLTKKAEPPPTHGVNRDSGTDSVNGGWLRRLVRRLGFKWQVRQSWRSQSLVCHFHGDVVLHKITIDARTNRVPHLICQWCLQTARTAI